MRLTLDDEALRLMRLFESMTGASAIDCLIETNRIVFVVTPGEMGLAIGPDGRTVKALEERLDRRVHLVEGADTPAAFVANTLAPAAVYNVTVSEGETTIAYAEVDRADRGVAIGRDGRTIQTARRLASRHYDIDEIEIV